MRLMTQYHRGMDWPSLAKRDSAQMRQTMERGFGKLIANQEAMTTAIEDGFAVLTVATLALHSSIEQLRADFNWGIGEILWKLETQNQTLQSILTTLQAPLDTQARELRQRAEEAYRNGWYEEALRDFMASEQKNYQDFVVLLAIGNIYLYQQQLINLDKALEYYIKTGKYATPVSPFHAAIGYMFAGFTAYLKNDDRAAIAHAQRATELAPSYAEAWFNLSKFAASGKADSLALSALEKAIRINRSYALKARIDSDFDLLEAEIAVLINMLRAEAKQQAELSLGALEQSLQNTTVNWGGQHIHDLKGQVLSLIQDDTYFAMLDAQAIIRNLEILMSGEEYHGKLEIGQIYYLDVNEKGDIIASAGNRSYHDLVDIKSQKRLIAFQRPENEANISKIHPNRKCTLLAYLNVVKNPGLIQIWNIEDSVNSMIRQISPPASPISVSFSPDGEWIACGLANGAIGIWEVRSGTLLAMLQGHTSNIGGKPLQLFFRGVYRQYASPSMDGNYCRVATRPYAYGMWPLGLNSWYCRAIQRLFIQSSLALILVLLLLRAQIGRCAYGMLKQGPVVAF